METIINMKAKKSLGQNFLIDEEVTKKIVSSIGVNKNDLIIEIGPGMGALTKLLKNYNTKIICYEIDTDLKPYLNKLEDDNTKIIYKDILESNISDDIEDIKFDKLYIIGNLPYYITTPIIKKIISSKIDVKEMLFMVQDEVANRWTSKPGNSEYGSITLYLTHFYNIEKLFKVYKKSFDPIPKVDSAVIKFSKRSDIPNVDEKKYFKLIGDSFKMKRKKLKNNLVGYDFEKIEKILERNGLSKDARAEEIPEKVFIEITRELL